MDTGYQKFLETKQRLTNKRSPTKIGVEEMDLPQLLEIEQKFLSWYPTTNSPEKSTKKHIYDAYIKPRIEKLQFETGKLFI